MNMKILMSLTLCGIPLFATYAEANASKSISFKDTEGKQVSKDDTLYLFGWMEDGCIGDTVGYKKLKQNNEEFIKASMGMKTLDKPDKNGEIYQFYIKPKSQWKTAHSGLVSKLNMTTNTEYTEYHMKLNNKAKYRGQPIQEFQYKFRPESEGGEYVLKFAPKADISSLMTQFKTRRTLDWEGENYINQRAKYDKKANSITCYF